MYRDFRVLTRNYNHNNPLLFYKAIVVFFIQRLNNATPLRTELTMLGYSAPNETNKANFHHDVVPFFKRPYDGTNLMHLPSCCLEIGASGFLEQED